MQWSSYLDVNFVDSNHVGEVRVLAVVIEKSKVFSRNTDFRQGLE